MAKTSASNERQCDTEPLCQCEPSTGLLRHPNSNYALKQEAQGAALLPSKQWLVQVL